MPSVAKDWSPPSLQLSIVSMPSWTSHHAYAISPFEVVSSISYTGFNNLQAICAVLSVPACGAGEAKQSDAAGRHTGFSHKPAGEPCSCGDCCASCHLTPMGQVMVAM